ncbi:MAG: hypothetical protein U5P41_10105 [Gammaproteobacteria bacterium]|nr:hypothetical protein [Gammaproteobacteria bacterium]
MRDLFFNMPARRKFMRTEQTEFLHIQELVKCLSLSRPDLGVRPGRVTAALSSMSVPPAATSGSRSARYSVAPSPSAACLVDETDDSHAPAGRRRAVAAAARSQADRQYLFLNGRLIRDRRLIHALRTAYQEIAAGRPLCAVPPVPGNAPGCLRHQRASDQARGTFS